MNGGDPTAGLIMLGLFLALYFLPSIWAKKVGHPNSDAIMVLNLFLGWTFVGWVIALVWAVKK